MAIFMGLTVSAFAEVSLPKILGDNMVLQRNQPVPIWGTARSGERVTVRFAGQEKSTNADGKGNWRVNLDPMEASAEPCEMTVSGENTLTLGNILVGEVWLCSGQSNMEMPVSIGTKPTAPIAVTTDKALIQDVEGDAVPGIRLFKVEKEIRPPDVVSTGWNDCHGDALARFSVIGYLFARDLQHELGVPVGVIQSAWGGQRIEVFTPPEAYEHSKAFAEEAKRNPLEIDGVAPGQKYDAMVRPLIPFAVRGVLWYQGESNLIECNDGMRYADKMEVLINSWRAAWQREKLPFLYVQIAPYAYSKRERKLAHTETALPELWEAQAKVLSLPATGMVPTTDLSSNLRNIHPQEKRPVAERLARLALAKVYGKNDPGLGSPMLDQAVVRGRDVLVRFNPVAGTLSSRDGQPLTCFEVSGPDGIFHPAQAQIIDTNVVTVSSSEVQAPEIVRFGWNETAQPSLVDANGWPAYPFRMELK